MRNLVRCILFFLLLFPLPALSAQGQPAPATGAWLTGTWRLDASRIANGSPSLAAYTACGPGASVPRAALTGELVPTGSQGWSVAAGGLAERRGRLIVQDARPPGVVMIQVNDRELTIDDDDDGSVAWVPDGVKRPEAQVDGGTLEVTAKWKGRVLLTERKNAQCGVSVRREFRPGEDDRSLELKIVISSRLLTQEKKFHYDRDLPGSTR